MPALAEVISDLESPYEVVLCGEHPRYLLPSGLEVGHLASLDAMNTADTVIVPGVAEPLTRRSGPVLASLDCAYRAGARMVSFCGGAFLLAQAGILDSRRATTHWILTKEFRDAFPRVRLDTDHLYIDDGPVHTSGGIFSATDLSLHLIALDRGQAIANDTGRILVSPPYRPGGQSQFVKDSIRIDHDSPTTALLQWIRDHLDQPITLAELAKRQHISQRSLVRHFRATTGMSVFDWITRERINRAKVLLETTDFRIGEVAAMVGFGTSETLRRNFDKAVGITASEYRHTFQSPSRQH